VGGLSGISAGYELGFSEHYRQLLLAVAA